MESLKKLMIVIFICSSNNISGKIGVAKKYIFRSFECSELQACNKIPTLMFSFIQIPVQKLPNLFPSSDPGPIGFSTCGRRGAHGVARVGTTSDYDRQDYFQILCCGRDIVVTILKLKCQKQKVHGEFGSTESLVRFLISAL